MYISSFLAYQVERLCELLPSLGIRRLFTFPYMPTLPIYVVVYQIFKVFYRLPIFKK